MERSSKLLYATIILTGLVAAIAWYGVNGWGGRQRPRLEGPRQGEIQVRSVRTEPMAVAGEEAGRAPAVDSSALESRAEIGAGWRVASEGGRPVAGTELRRLLDTWVRTAGEPWAPVRPLPAALVTSDEEGRFGELEPGRYVCSRKGFVPRLFMVGGDARGEQVLVLREAHGRRLVVVDSSGAAIAGARLLLPPEALGWSTTLSLDALVEAAHTDERGELALWSSMAAHAMAMVVREGYAPSFLSIPEPDAGEPFRVVLRESAVIEGRVLGTGSGRGPVAVRAEAEERAVPSPRHLPIAEADPDGRFRLDGLAAGIAWTLVPCVRLGEEWRPAGNAVTAIAPASGVELRLAEGFSVRVRASGPDGEVLAPSVLSSLMPAEVLAAAGDRASTLGPDGGTTWSELAWSFGRQDSTEIELWLACPGHATLSLGRIPLKAGSFHDLGEFVMERALTWPVRVVDAVDDRPIDGAMVRFVPAEVSESKDYTHVLLQEVKTDAQGLAELVCPRDVPGILQVTAAGGLIESKRRLTVTDCGETRIAMERPALLSIVCRTASGAPVPKARLQWRPVESPNWRPLGAGEDGVAELEVAAGNLWIRHAPGALEGRTAGGGTLTIDVHHDAEGQPHPSQEVAVEGLRPAEHRTVELVVPAMSQLGVHVTLDGMPATGCRLVGVPGTRLDIIDNDLWTLLDLPKAIVPADGVAILPGMPIGKMMLSASLPETRFVAYLVIEVLRPIDGLVEFPIETGTRAVTVRDGDGRPVAGVEVELRQLSFQHGIKTPPMVSETPAGMQRVEAEPTRAAVAVTDDKGSAHFDRVPAGGQFAASVRDAQRFPLLAPVVLSATDRHAVLKDGSGAAIRLRLVWSDDRPGSGIGFVVRSAEHRFRHLGTTGEDGELRVQGLAPGTYSVGLEVVERRLELRLEAGEDHEETVVLGG